MKYNFYFDIACILLTLMLILIVHLRRTYPTRTGRLYKALLWLNLVASGSDLCSAFIISFPEQYPMALNYLMNIVYVSAHNMTAVFFLLYIATLIRGSYGSRMEKRICTGIVAAELLVIVTTPLTKAVFYFDESQNYCRGPLMLWLYICAGVIVLYAMSLFIRYWNRMNVYQVVTNVSVLSLVGGAILLQCYDTSLLLETYCTTVALLVLNLSLDNSEVYFYPNSYCFNQNAFDDMVGRRLEGKGTFTLLAFTFDDLAVFRSRLGADDFEKVIGKAIGDCHKIFGQRRVYLLSNTSFVIDLGNGDVEYAMESLDQVVGKAFWKDDRVFDLQLHFCLLRNPGVAETVVDVNDALSEALFAHYRQNGQRLTVIRPELLDARRREARIIHILREAIQNDGFEVFYQPLYEQRTGKYISAEALVRLKRQPGEEFIGPDAFIPIAENNGLIVDIGSLVLEKVCRFWQKEKLPELGVRYIEVNLSKLQILELADAVRLEEICARYGMTPDNINLEITETAYVSEEEKAAVNQCIQYLRGKGFRFSLDDYGSGYANASYFAEMPFHIVKIDRDMLWNAMKDESFRVVLENSVHLIKAFRRECVVEGVETPEMAEMLTALDCDFFQGYLYSRPINEGAFLAFLKENR